MKKAAFGLTGTILSIGATLGASAGTASGATLSLIPMVTRICDSTAVTGLGAQPSASTEQSLAIAYAKNSGALASAKAKLLGLGSSNPEESALVASLAAQVGQQQAFYAKLQRLAKTRALRKNWSAVATTHQNIVTKNNSLQNQLTSLGGTACGFLPTNGGTDTPARPLPATASAGQGTALIPKAAAPSAVALRPVSQSSGAVNTAQPANAKPIRTGSALPVTTKLQPAQEPQQPVDFTASVPQVPTAQTPVSGQTTVTTKQPSASQPASTGPATSTTGARSAARFLPNIPGLPLRPLSPDEQNLSASLRSALTSGPEVLDAAATFVGGDASAIAMVAEINLTEESKAAGFLKAKGDYLKSTGFVMRASANAGTFQLMTGTRANETVVIAARSGNFVGFLSNNPASETAVRKLLSAIG